MNPPIKTKFTQAEAAIAVGYVKSKISQDMKEGTLSFKRLEKNGRVEIDGSELHRVYGDRFKPERLMQGSQNSSQNLTENDAEPKRTQNEPNALAVEVKFLREQIALLDRMHGGEREQLARRIEELKSSLEDAREQRDKALTLLDKQTDTVKLLTDQRARETAIPVPPSPPDPSSEVEPARQSGGFFGLFRKRRG